MTVVASRRPSASGQPSGAATAYLMESAFFVDEDPYRRRRSEGASAQVPDDDDESIIFPSTASLAGTSVAAGLPAFRAGGGGGSPPYSPRRKSYNGPYLYEIRKPGSRSPGTSFDSSVCDGSVASTLTAGPSASVAGGACSGSFDYGADNAAFASSAYPSPRASPRRRSLGDQYSHSPRRHQVDQDDDLVSDVTTLSVAQTLESESRDDEAAAIKSHRKKGRGRGAMKSLSRSFRSRSPGLRSISSGKTLVNESSSVDGLETSHRPQSATERRRSRTRSPLRKVADSISSGIKKTRKGRRRSRSLGAEPVLGAAANNSDLAGRAAKLLASTSSINPAEDCEDDDGSVFSLYSMGSCSVGSYSVGSYSVGSVGSYSTAPSSVTASSVASAPAFLRSSPRLSRHSTGTGGMRRVSSQTSVSSLLPTPPPTGTGGMRRVTSTTSVSSLLPTLIREDEVCEDPLDTSRLGEEDDDPSCPAFEVPLVDNKGMGKAHRGETAAVEFVEKQVRKSLLQRAKNRSFRRSRSRSRDAKRRGWDDDSASVASDVSAPARMQRSRFLPRPHRPKAAAAAVATKAAAPPSKVFEVSTGAAPLGLSGRMSTDRIVAQLRAGSGAADAVRQLRELQSCLTARGPSSRCSKLSYWYVADIPVPDYAAYVEGAVERFGRSMGVSTQDYRDARDALLGWTYYGNEV